MRVLFIILSLFACIFFSNCSINHRFIKNKPVRWSEKWENKMLSPSQKKTERLESQTPIAIRHIQNSILVAEKMKDSRQMKKNVENLEIVAEKIHKIAPNLFGSLASIGSIEDVKPFISKYKYFHLKIEADSLYEKKEYLKALKLINSHASSNPTAISNADILANHILKIRTDTIIAQYGEANPYYFSKGVKALSMLTPIIDISKYNYIGSLYNGCDYESFFVEMRLEAYQRLLKFADEQTKLGYFDELKKLYDAAEDIAVTSQEIDTIRQRKFKSIKTCRDELLKRINTSIENYQFEKACELEEDILKCDPNYTSRCKAEEAKYHIRLAEDYYEYEDWKKAEKQINMALKIEPENLNANNLKNEIRKRIGEQYNKEGREASSMSKFDLALELFKKALEYTPKEPRYENDIREIRDQIGIAKMGQAEKFKQNAQCKEAYYRAKEAIGYMKDDTESVKFMKNVQECATTKVAFAIVLSDGFRFSGSIEENKVKSFLQREVEEKRGELIDILPSGFLPIFTDRSDAIYAAKMKGIDELLLFEINSYKKYGGDTDWIYDNYATIYTSYWKDVYVKKGCGGILLAPYDCWKSVFVREECETVKYTKIIDNLSVNIGLNKQWLNPTTEESYSETSNYLSNSFEQETWHYPGKNKKGNPMYLYLRKYAGGECRKTASLDMSYFKRSRKSIPTHAELASNRIIQYLN